jgi:peptidyl-prolyl cis-trans isomerase B (cyclophilin B)
MQSKVLIILAIILVGLLVFLLFFHLPRKTAVNDTIMDRESKSSERVIMELSNSGKLIIELYADVAPYTVENFKKLIKKKFYNGLKFHRVVPGFVVQGGDPNGDGTGGPGYSIDSEFNDKPHLLGTVAMARSNDPNSAGSQFYICLAPQPSLDGKYTVFGQVVEGLEFLPKIKAGEKIEQIYLVAN